MPAPETARRRGKRSGATLLAAPLAVAVALAFTPPALAQATINLRGTGACPPNSTWSTTFCWDLGRAPITADDAVIDSATATGGGAAERFTTYDLGAAVQLRSVTLNSASGDVTISGGPIGLQSGGFITNNWSNVGNNDFPSITLNGPATFSNTAATSNFRLTGAVTGTGSLTLSSTGQANGLQLLTVNSYAGATIIGGTAGVLANVNGAIPTGSAVTVNTGASLTFGASSTIGSLAGGGNVALGATTLTTGSDNTSTTYSGVLSGTGSLVKAGTGTFTLSGANTYSGGTTVNAGTLNVSADNNLGAATGALSFGGGTLQLGASFNLAGTRALALNAGGGTIDTSGFSTTVSQAITGTGGLTKSGTGTLTLSGANTYSGGTTVSAGTLSAGAANVFGTGAMIVSSGAMLDLAGFGYTVGAGATLGGTGTVNGAVTIANGGILAPGNSIGTITVSGSLTFNAGSIYRVEVDAAGNTDRTNVTGAPGTATLNGGTVDVQAGAGIYQASTRYTILNATGGVTGTFAGVTSNLAFLTPALSYGANDAFLTLTRNNIGFTGVAATANQRAVATVLQAGIAGATGDLATAINAVTGLSAPQAQGAFDSIGGASLVALRRAGAAFAGGFGQQLNRRLGAVASNEGQARAAAFGSPLQFAANDWHADASPIHAQAYAPSASGDQAARGGRGFWIRGYGAGLNTDSDGNAAAGTLRGGGLSAGADREFGDGLVLGLAATYGSSRVSVSGVSDSGRARGAGLGGYASYVSGPWTFKGIAGLAWNTNHMDRGVVFGGINRTASSDFDGRSVSGYAEATYGMKLGGYRVQPLAALSYVRTKTDGFTESGAGALNLQVSEQTTRSTRSLLGAKTVHEVGNMTLEPRLLWAHEFGNVNAPMTASLTGAPVAGSFQVAGVELKRDSLVLGLGASSEIRKGVNLFADAQVEGNSRQRGVGFFVGVRGVW